MLELEFSVLAVGRTHVRRIALFSARPRDLSSLRDSLHRLAELRLPLQDTSAPLLDELLAELSTPETALDLLCRAIQIEPAPQCGPEIGCTSDAVPSTTVASPDEPTRSGSIAVGEPNGAPWSGAWIIGVDGNHLVRRATLAHDMGGRTDPILRSLVVDSSIWTVSDRTVGRTNATSPTSTAIVRF